MELTASGFLLKQEAPGAVLSKKDGMMKKKQQPEQNSETPPAVGEDLVVVGTIGQTGCRVLLEAKKEELSQRFSASYLQNCSEIQEPQIASCIDWLNEEGVTAVEPAEEGGIFRAIWDLSGKYPIGVAFWLRSIPIRQHTIEVCEQCGCNPYRLWCGSCLLLTVKNGGQLVEKLNEQGYTASVIGRVTAGTARVILHGEEQGYLERPREDELYRLLGEDVSNQLIDQLAQAGICPGRSEP